MKTADTTKEITLQNSKDVGMAQKGNAETGRHVIWRTICCVWFRFHIYSRIYIALYSNIQHHCALYGTHCMAAYV